MQNLIDHEYPTHIGVYVTMHPNEPASLKGKDAEAFDRYQKRKGTKEEIAFAKRSDEFYRKHKPKD